jgi:hypothetical protein
MSEKIKLKISWINLYLSLIFLLLEYLSTFSKNTIIVFIFGGFGLFFIGIFMGQLYERYKFVKLKLNYKQFEKEK